MTIRVLNDTSAERIDAAAAIWAAATAARDGDPNPAATELARSRLDEVLTEAPDAFLLAALDPAGAMLGFALTQPAPDDGPAVLRFFAVHPDAWGRGIGALLLGELERDLRRRGCPAGELWVNQDNPAAIALYRRAGWREDGTTRVNQRSGRTMTRLSLDLTFRGAKKPST